MSLLDSALTLLAPHHCLNCQKEGSLCCQICLEQIKQPKHKQICYFCNKEVAFSRNFYGICSACRPNQSLDSIQSFAEYKNKVASQLVKSLKFNQTHETRKPIASSLLSLKIPLISSSSRTLVSAVPTANSRVRKRGWDQAKLIAKQYAKLKRLPYKSLLIRKSSFDQIGASKSARKAASAKFFSPHRLSLIQNSTIVLIDDVVTTGSSLSAAARTLKSAGASEVHALTFAHQPLGKLQKSQNSKNLENF